MHHAFNIDYTKIEFVDLQKRATVQFNIRIKIQIQCPNRLKLISRFLPITDNPDLRLNNKSLKHLNSVIRICLCISGECVTLSYSYELQQHKL